MDPKLWHRHYDPGVPAAIDYKEWPICSLLNRTAERYPDHVALIFLNCKLTYRELKDQVDRLATVFTNLGVVKDSRVAVHLPNLPQTVIAHYAALACGAQVVMTNPMYVAREIVHQWGDAEVDVVVTADFLYERSIAPIKDQLKVRHYLVTSIPEYLRFPLKQLAPLKLKKQKPPAIAPMPTGPNIHPFRKTIDGTAPAPPCPDVSMDDLCALQYTGGTTGVSKGAMLSHRNLSYNAQQVRAWMPKMMPGTEVFLAALPYFHIFGMTVCMNVPVMMGAAIVIMPNPRDIPQMIKNVTKHRITLMPGVPAIFGAILNTPGIEKLDLTSVKAVFSGSAPLPEDVTRRFEALTGAVIFEGFGLTETSPATHVNPIDGMRKTGFVGMPVSDTDARVVDMNTGLSEMPPGEEGELIVKGPQIMVGYWKRQDETDLMIKDGWLFTGDLAIMDEDGYFKIVGRKKDMILASGYNIYPDEIDQVLTDFTGIVESCTIGVPDKKRGETVKSFVVKAEGSEATVDELMAHCRENLAAYKVPRAIEFRDELPKSAMMKLLRRTLRDEELAKG
ncbi:MAG: long-chain acyl-CoA synthetase [Pseudohongiellaceae bacterium]|jgi:long-chain acyl-CoA synthetase